VLIGALQQANWRCLSICDSPEIGDQPSLLNEMILGTKALHAYSHGRIAWARHVWRSFEIPVVAERVITGLQSDFKQDTDGVRIWKNVGMAIRSKSGHGPVLTPILEEIETTGRNLLSGVYQDQSSSLGFSMNTTTELSSGA
jgi:hypothetical protein